MELGEITEYIKASKDVLDIFKTVAGLLPKGPDADKARQQLEQAEKALRASEAQLAKALGYTLCECTFPPQIMLWRQEGQIVQCPNCGNYSDPHRRVVRDDPTGGGWAGARRKR